MQTKKMTQFELETLWRSGALSDKTYKFGASLRFIRTGSVGQTGRLVALLDLDPPQYIIEFPDGTSTNATHADVELVPSAPRATQSDEPSLLAEIGLGLLCGLVFGPLLIIRFSSPRLNPPANPLWVAAGALFGGGCAGWLHYITRHWRMTLPALYPWRSVLVAAGAAQIVGCLATLLGLSPVFALPLWSVFAGASVILSKLKWMSGVSFYREDWSGFSWRGLRVAIFICVALITLSFALARYT